MAYNPKHQKHYNYKPLSWSQQARELADKIYANCQGENGWTREQARQFFSTPYKNDLIRNRSAKRFGKLWRKEIKNNSY